MCIEIHYQNKEITCQKEFAEIFGIDNLIFREKGEHFEPEVCLCPIDLDRSAELLSMTSERDESCLFVVFHKNEKPHEIYCPECNAKCKLEYCECKTGCADCEGRTSWYVCPEC